DVKGGVESLSVRSKEGQMSSKQPTHMGISKQDPGKLVSRNIRAQGSGARGKNDVGVEARRVLGQSAHELVGEHVLANRDEQRATEGLREHNDCCARWNVDHIQHGLDSQRGLLQSETKTQPKDDLVWDPFRVARGHAESGDQSRADTGDDGRGNHERGVVSHLSDDYADRNRGENERQDHGQGGDARVDSRDVVDRLEVDRE
ncbi:unnamed protein product, partial [Mycena citricolor]